MIDTQKQGDTQLARLAADGDRTARHTVNEKLHPLIEYHTNKWCQRFCHENRFIYRCSLTHSVGSHKSDAMLCEWGNASYGWMLNDLGSTQRLLKYDGRNGAGLFDYCYRIANSLPFYERWKDWRFGRRVHVPTYIQDISPQAAGVFYGLRAHHELALIAQHLALSLQQVETITHQIINSLTQRNRLYLLDPPVIQSLTTQADEENDEPEQQEIPCWDEAIETQQQKETLQQAWSELNALEQYVLEALVIDEMDAQSLLQVLLKMDLTIKKGVSAKQTTVQQLYYFKRKTLNKLEKILND